MLGSDAPLNMFHQNLFLLRNGFSSLEDIRHLEVWEKDIYYNIILTELQQKQK
jgi:hypothetical protein